MYNLEHDINYQRLSGSIIIELKLQWARIHQIEYFVVRERQSNFVRDTCMYRGQDNLVRNLARACSDPEEIHKPQDHHVN